MDDFFAMPPWWVVAGLAAALVVAGVKFVRWTGRVDSRIETLTDGMAEVREDIKKILGRLPPTPPTVQSRSPVQSTDFGKKTSDAA